MRNSQGNLFSVPIMALNQRKWWWKKKEDEKKVVKTHIKRQNTVSNPLQSAERLLRQHSIIYTCQRQLCLLMGWVIFVIALNPFLLRFPCRYARMHAHCQIIMTTKQMGAWQKKPFFFNWMAVIKVNDSLFLSLSHLFLCLKGTPAWLSPAFATKLTVY